MDIQTEVSIHVFHGVEEINADEWNELSAGIPFQSYNWYRYGELVMADCQPLHLLAYRNNRLIGRASLWVVRNEPLPTYAGIWRAPLQMILKKWPLLVCRSPFSSASGLIVSSDVGDRKMFLSAILNKAVQLGRERNCSVLMFDFLGRAELQDWPDGIAVMEFPNAGTIMWNQWRDFDDYLAGSNGKNRKNYRRTMRESDKFKLGVQQNVSLDEINTILPLVRNAQRRYGAPPNPWVADMLRYMDMVDGQLVTVTDGEKMIGCGLLLEDNKVQMTTAFGRSHDMPFLYMTVIYKSIRQALDRKLTALRWGSGAYDLKKKLGFELEDNGAIVFAPIHPFIRRLSALFGF